MRLPIQALPVVRQPRFGLAAIASFAGAYRGIFPQDKCSTCTTILADVIHTAAEGTCWLGCKGLGVAVGAACDLAFGGPEDPIGDVVCPIAGAAASTICNQFGCSYLKTWTGAKNAAHQICSEVKLC